MITNWLLALAVSGDLTDKSYFIINRPQSLANSFPDGVDHNTALFGIPAYGHGASISGSLVYSVPDDLQGCTPIDKSRSIRPWPTAGTVIVMVDRGNCTFVTKVRHAEEAGAHAAIVVDNSDEGTLPFMADDGTGGSISIASMLIHKNDGQSIKDALVTNPVVVTLGWNMPNPETVVDWELWSSAADPPAVDFKHSFKPVVASLSNTATMTPRYFIWDGVINGCTDPDLPCGNQCSNSGRYCSVDPDGDISKGASGMDVVQENLRQMCLWRVLNSTGNGLLWWNYADQYQTRCTVPATFTEYCSTETMKNISLDQSTINAVTQCVTGSGGSDYRGGKNTLLDAELAYRVSLGIYFLPTVVVDQVPYRGSLACPEPIEQSHCGVLKAICASFADGYAPSACSPCGVTRQIDACGECLDPRSLNFNKSCAGCDNVPNSGKWLDACGVCNGLGRDHCGNCFPVGDPRRIDDPNYSCQHADGPLAVGMPVYGVVLIVLACVFVVGAGVYCYMRRQERAMRSDIDSLLKQYFPLSETNANPPQRPPRSNQVAVDTLGDTADD